MKGDRITIFWVIVAICTSVLYQANAQTNNAPSTNQTEQTEAEPITIQIGDPFEHVLKVLGEPRIDCPLRGGKHVLFYEAGEVHFKDNKVTSYSMLTTEQVAEKREEEQRQIQTRQQQQVSLYEIRKANLEKYNRSIRSREAKLTRKAKLLTQQKKAAYDGMMNALYESHNKASAYWAVSTHSRYSVRDLMTTDPDEYYLAGADFVSDMNRRRMSPEERLAFTYWLHSYETFRWKCSAVLRANKELDPILDELDKIKTKRNRIYRHGY